MPMSTAQRPRQDTFYYPSGCQSEYTLFHTTRVIKYVFLDGSQNITPSLHTSPGLETPVGYLESAKRYYCPLVCPDHSLASSYWPPDLERLPIFVTLSKSQERSGRGWGRPPLSRDRLPVFRKLCREAALWGSHHHEDLAGPKTTKDEPEKTGEMKEPGLGEKLEAEKENEPDSSVSQLTLGERGIQL